MLFLEICIKYKRIWNCFCRYVCSHSAVWKLWEFTLTLFWQKFMTATQSHYYGNYRILLPQFCLKNCQINFLLKNSTLTWFDEKKNCVFPHYYCMECRNYRNLLLCTFLWQKFVKSTFLLELIPRENFLWEWISCFSHHFFRNNFVKVKVLLAK